MVRSVISNRDSQGNMRISQVRISSPGNMRVTASQVVSPGNIRVTTTRVASPGPRVTISNKLRIDGSKPNLPRVPSTPNGVKVITYKSPNQFKDGNSP